MASFADRHPTIAYIAPFLIYVGLMALPVRPEVLHPVRFVVVLAVILWLSRPYLSLKPSRAVGSVIVGLAVFVIWVAPDLLFGYRHHWLFENSILGKSASTLDPALHRDYFFLTVRILTSAGLVPILEELFWRGWLMRWLIDSQNFLKVSLGQYRPLSFWAVAILFASEHGPYWEVGLLAGIAYNWWIIRTKNLADCILAHAVTNAILAVYVLAYDQWQYWL